MLKRLLFLLSCILILTTGTALATVADEDVAFEVIDTSSSPIYATTGVRRMRHRVRVDTKYTATVRRPNITGSTVIIQLDVGNYSLLQRGDMITCVQRNGEYVLKSIGASSWRILCDESYVYYDEDGYNVESKGVELVIWDKSLLGVELAAIGGKFPESIITAELVDTEVHSYIITNAVGEKLCWDDGLVLSLTDIPIACSTRKDAEDYLESAVVKFPSANLEVVEEY